jgi:hypothetical protein
MSLSYRSLAILNGILTQPGGHKLSADGVILPVASGMDTPRFWDAVGMGEVVLPIPESDFKPTGGFSGMTDHPADSILPKIAPNQDIERSLTAKNSQRPPRPYEPQWDMVKRRRYKRRH